MLPISINGVGVREWPHCFVRQVGAADRELSRADDVIIFPYA